MVAHQSQGEKGVNNLHRKVGLGEERDQFPLILRRKRIINIFAATVEELVGIEAIHEGSPLPVDAAGKRKLDGWRIHGVNLWCARCWVGRGVGREGPVGARGIRVIEVANNGGHRVENVVTVRTLWATPTRGHR